MATTNLFSNCTTTGTQPSVISPTLKFTLKSLATITEKNPVDLADRVASAVWSPITPSQKRLRTYIFGGPESDTGTERFVEAAATVIEDNPLNLVP